MLFNSFDKINKTRTFFCKTIKQNFDKKISVKQGTQFNGGIRAKS
jgi:hypothetical protein